MKKSAIVVTLYNSNRFCTSRVFYYLDDLKYTYLSETMHESRIRKTCTILGYEEPNIDKIFNDKKVLDRNLMIKNQGRKHKSTKKNERHNTKTHFEQQQKTLSLKKNN